MIDKDFFIFADVVKYRPLQPIFEQDEEVDEEEEAQVQQPEQQQVQQPVQGQAVVPGQAPGPAIDPTTGQPMIDPTTGLPMEPEEPPLEMGKVYEMKKIYTKLISISNILDHYSDKEFNELRDSVLESIDIFHTILSNFSQFKDDARKIINKYYKFVESAVGELDRLTKKTN